MSASARINVTIKFKVMMNTNSLVTFPDKQKVSIIFKVKVKEGDADVSSGWCPYEPRALAVDWIQEGVVH